MGDRRFLRAEKAMVETVTENPEVTSVSKLAKKAKVSRVTLYRHHKSVFSIMGDLEKYLRKKFKRRLRGFEGVKNATLERVYLEGVLFVLKHQWIFKALVLRMGVSGFDLIIEGVRPWFEAEMGMPKNSERMFMVYKAEVGVILLEWAGKGFDDCEMERVLRDIMHLSKTARGRLMWLAE